MTVTLFAVFARAVGFFAKAPGFSHAGIPAHVRVASAFGIAFALVPSLGPTHTPDAAAFVVLCAGETLVGAVLGVGATLVAEAVAAAGRILDDLAGIRASVPGIAVAPAGFGGLWTLVFATAFLTLGGAEAMIAAFAHSFQIVPLGAAVKPDLLRHTGFAFGVSFLRLSLELAAPAICVVLCIHIGSAALSRALPRMAQLAVAFPIGYAGVLLVAFTSLAVLRELSSR
jgi:flagellar biosynthetic protein FliR